MGLFRLIICLFSSAAVTFVGDIAPAFHPESTTSVQLIIEGVSVLDWEGIAGTSELQDVPGAAGIEASSIKVQGQLAGGDYFGLLEVRHAQLAYPCP